jgi:hypothetical protein
MGDKIKNVYFFRKMLDNFQFFKYYSDMLKFWLVNIDPLIMYVGCINTGESAAAFGFPLRIKVVELLRPDTAAAGLLFHPPPITPLHHHPIFSKPINTQKTRIHISRVNNKL